MNEPLTKKTVDSGSQTEILMELRDLRKNFGKLEVLRGINLNVHRGDVLVLIGPSGSGKSTLLRSVNLLETPTAGQVIFEGKDLTKAGKNTVNYTVAQYKPPILTSPCTTLKNRIFLKYGLN